MNLVFVEGGSKFLREIAHKSVAYCIDQLLPRHKNLEIHVKIGTIKSDATGYCMMGDTINDYELELERDQTLREFICTICHEMVHLKQYAKKEMDGTCKENGDYRWKKETVPAKTQYSDLPWEKEAYELQETLADEIWRKNIV